MRILYLGLPLLVPALRALGATLYTVGLEASDFSVTHPFYLPELSHKLQKDGFAPDVVFCCDDGNLPRLLDPEHFAVPSVWYSIDTYCNPWHIPYAYGFDFVLVAQKDFVPFFANEGMHTRWFPLFCRKSELDETRNAALFTDKRDVPVSFVGTLQHKNNPARWPFLQAFRCLQPIYLHQGDYPPIFRRSQIVLNHTAFAEANFRCFEAPACGAALLMEQCGNGFDELFSLGEEVLPTFPRKDAIAAAAIASDYLARPKELARIAKAGFCAVEARHTDFVRARALLALFEELLAQHAHEVRVGAEQSRRTQLVRAAFGMIASELYGSAFPEHCQFYAELGRGHHPVARE